MAIQNRNEDELIIRVLTTICLLRDAKVPHHPGPTVTLVATGAMVKAGKEQAIDEGCACIYNSPVQSTYIG